MKENQIKIRSGRRDFPQPVSAAWGHGQHNSLRCDLSVCGLQKFLKRSLRHILEQANSPSLQDHKVHPQSLVSSCVQFNSKAKLQSPLPSPNPGLNPILVLLTICCPAIIAKVICKTRDDILNLGAGSCYFFLSLGQPRWKKSSIGLPNNNLATYWQPKSVKLWQEVQGLLGYSLLGMQPLSFEAAFPQQAQTVMMGR